MAVDPIELDADERDVRADERDRRADERDRRADERDEEVGARERNDVEGDDLAAVAAHNLLNSSAVISMGIETLQGHWELMAGADRVSLLQRMLAHASSIDDRLRDLVQGRLSLVRSKGSKQQA